MVETSVAAIVRLRKVNDAALDALSGLAGLIELLLNRDDLPAGVRDALLNNHRVIDAKAAIGKLQAETESGR